MNAIQEEWNETFDGLRVLELAAGRPVYGDKKLQERSLDLIRRLGDLDDWVDEWLPEEEKALHKSRSWLANTANKSMHPNCK